MTLLILIFSEVLPKTFAFNHPDRLALAVAPVLVVLIRLLRPAVLAIRFVVQMALRLLGERIEAPYSHSSHEEELRGAIELHRGETREIRDRKSTRLNSSH